MDNQKIEDNKIKSAKYKNVKLYPIYKIFAWDLLFYYSIIFLFLNQVKGISVANIVFGNAFYEIFKIVFQPIIPIIVNKIGKRKGTIFGNIFVSLSILYTIIGKPSMIYMIIFNLIMALGYILKGVCEASILDECITDMENKNSIFSKIDGRGSAYWYAFEAISSLITGFLFVINGYIPMYLCFIFCIIGTIISANFENYEVKHKDLITEKHKIRALKQKVDLDIQEYLFIFKSKRLRALLMFSGLFHGLLYVRSTLTSSLLVEMNVPDEFFGIIIGALTMFAAIATFKQNILHKKLHNKLMTVLSLTYIFSLIIIGIVINLKISFIITLVIAITMMAIQNMIKGPYYTLIKRYLNSFSNPKISTKIYSVNSFVEDIGGTMISLIVSVLLKYFSSANTTLFIGIFSLFLFIAVLDYMKTRIGLKPEEYRKQDIEFVPKIKQEPTDINSVGISIDVDERGENKIDVYTLTK